MKLIGKYKPEMHYHKNKLLIRDDSGSSFNGDPPPQLNAGYYDFWGFTGEFKYDWTEKDKEKYFKGNREDIWSVEIFLFYSPTISEYSFLFESGSYKIYIDGSGQLIFKTYYSAPSGSQDIILGDMTPYDNTWIKIVINCDGVNLTAHVYDDELYSGTIISYLDGLQYPSFKIADKDNEGRQSISYVKLVSNQYRFLWTFDYMEIDGWNDTGKVAVDLSMNAVHLLPTHPPDSGRYQRSGKSGNHPEAPGLLNTLGYAIVGPLYEPLKIDASKSAYTLNTDIVYGKIPNTAQIISANCGHHITDLREVRYTNPEMDSYMSGDFCMGIIFQKSDLKTHSGHQLLLHKGANWNTATHISGARFNSNNNEITMYFRAPGIATLPDISHASFADNDSLLFVISRSDGVIRATLEKIGDIESRVTALFNIDNDLSGNTYPLVIGAYGDASGEDLENTKVMAPFFSNTALTEAELDLISLKRYYPDRLEIIIPIDEGSGSIIRNSGSLGGSAILNNSSGYWSTQDVIHISLLGLQPENGTLNMMRFFSADSKINFNMWDTYEMGLVNDLQSVELSDYTFGDTLVDPAFKTVRNYNDIADYETDFTFELAPDTIVLITDDERHDMISKNGADHR